MSDSEQQPDVELEERSSLSRRLLALFFIGAGVNFLIGAGVHAYGSVGVPVAVTAGPFIVGLAVLPLCLETRGEKLPD